MSDRRRHRTQSLPPAMADLQRILTAHPWSTGTGVVALTTALGLVDFALGPEITIYVFYLLPVAIAAWTLPLRATAAIACIAAVTWYLADRSAGQTYTHEAIPLWNTLTRFAVYMMVAALLAQLRQSLDQEQRLARQDPLTGLSNGRWFYQQSSDLLRLHPDARPMFVYLDLDDFKSINDAYGHSGGDRALRAVGAALQLCLREGDLVGRLGGDEFGILTVVPPGDDPAAHAQSILGRVVTVLRDLEPPVSFSGGVVSFESPPRTVDEAIEAADALMYSVKQSGKHDIVHEVVSARPAAG